MHIYMVKFVMKTLVDCIYNIHTYIYISTCAVGFVGCEIDKNESQQRQYFDRCLDVQVPRIYTFFKFVLLTKYRFHIVGSILLIK